MIVAGVGNGPETLDNFGYLDPMLKILLATGNPHKLEEVRAILPPPPLPEDAQGGSEGGVVLLSLADAGLDDLAEPVEDADTFEGNALIKARYYAHHPRNTEKLACLADDSGLEVDALGGAPGVYSARYAGATGSRQDRDLANNAKLLKSLAGTPSKERAARFVCALAYVDPNTDDVSGPSEASGGWVGRGVFEGAIILPEQAMDQRAPECGRGGNGFGYDPLFLVAGLENTTSAELSEADKNARSHRGDAVRKWLSAMGSRLA